MYKNWLADRIITLSNFLFWLSDRCKPIFTLLREKKPVLDVECTTDFEQLKEQLMHSSTLLAPQLGETLHMDLSVSKYAVSVVLF